MQFLLFQTTLMQFLLFQTTLMQCLLFQTTLTQFLLFQTTIKQFLLFQPTLMQFLLFQTTLMHMFYFSLPSWRTCSVPVFLSCMLLPAAVAWDKAAGSRRSSYSSLLVKLGTRIMILVNALPRYWREGKNRCVTLCRNKKKWLVAGWFSKNVGNYQHCMHANKNILLIRF